MACFVEWAICLFGGLVNHGVVGPMGPMGFVVLLIFQEIFFVWGLFDLFLGTGCDLQCMFHCGVQIKPDLSWGVAQSHFLIVVGSTEVMDGIFVMLLLITLSLLLFIVLKNWREDIVSFLILSADMFP